MFGSCFLHILADILTNNSTTNTEYVSILLQVLPKEQLKEIEIMLSRSFSYLFPHLSLFVAALTSLIVNCFCDGGALSFATLTFPTLYGGRYPLTMP